MKVKPLATLEVIPTIPDVLRQLPELANNLLWSWNPDICALFRSLDSLAWTHWSRNPARMLREVSQKRLNEAAENSTFVDHYNRCLSYLQHYLKEPTWFDKMCGRSDGKGIVYFSMEYGLTECVRVYSGGLGVLSGDHLKSASDLGLPLVGIGLAYHQGYFQQQLTADGYQTELYPENDFSNLPVAPVMDDKGERLKIELNFPGRTVFVGAWKVQVGRVPLFLLDTDLPENNPADRRITYVLYGGDKETRVQQEMVLGMGGVEMVSKLGIATTVCHMNEGHSAFIQIARLIHLRHDLGLSTDEALTLIRTGSVFTTHTPVPAGIDQFPADLMDHYMGHYVPQTGLTRDELLALGSKVAGAPGQLFNMAIFAMRTSDATNAVSRLHGDVSRSLWEESWPNLPHDEIPIDYITNGIHVRTWISDHMATLYDRYLGTEWRRDPDHKDVWNKVRDIPDEELWNAHVVGREELVDFTRRRMAEQRARTTGVEMTPEERHSFLDPHALTIGFARRFATYKRATLLLRYPERLLALLRDKERPLQIVFAGKAHPQDDAGKSLIRDIIYFARSQGVEHRLVFIENYDMEVARFLTGGVDVWLNTPRRPLEASGTSGMKVLANGALNLSILDGWWEEAYDPTVGWAIGRDKTVADDKIQDDRDATSLYDLLEKHVVPLFYAFEDGQLPRRWIAKAKESIVQLVPRYNSIRMVKQYCHEYYAPAMSRCRQLVDKDCAGAKELAAWKRNVRDHWNEITISSIHANGARTIASSSEVDVQARVSLGSLTAADVEVHAYFGPLQNDGTIVFSGRMVLEPQADDGGLIYRGKLIFPETGKFGYTLRVVPYHPMLGDTLKMGLVHWASS